MEIQVPSVPLAPISPWIVGSAELVIEMSSEASSAPSAPAKTAIQSSTEAFSCSGQTVGAAGVGRAGASTLSRTSVTRALPARDAGEAADGETPARR